MDVLARNNVTVTGNPAGPPMVFSHGFGCDQNMWRFVAPAFEETHRVVALRPRRLRPLRPCGLVARALRDAARLRRRRPEICAALDLTDVIFVGHSVSSMIGVLAAKAEPERFEPARARRAVAALHRRRRLPSAASASEDIAGLLESLESNYLGWSSTMAPVIVGNPDRPELGDELTNSFCQTDPQIAAHFARVTFFSDNREDLAARRASRRSILQCSRRRARAAGHRRVRPRPACPAASSCSCEATGHCPNLSAPDETVAAIRAFV